MKKASLFLAIAMLAISSCTKEAVNRVEDNVSTQNAGAANRASKWVDVKETFTVQWSAWNQCTGEWVDFSGTGHYSLQGTINKNGFNFNVHYNASNVVGVGRTTGTIYRAMDSFNYHNKGSFVNGQAVFQQTGTIRYTSKGNEPDLFSEDGWHMTVNANGEVTSFRTTEGRIYSCR